MTQIFRINEELASTSVVANELLSISRELTTFIRNDGTRQLYLGIIAEVNKSFSVLETRFSPLMAISDYETFLSGFAPIYAEYKAEFLLDVSKPRKYCDNVYDDYIQLGHTKEARSSFPSFKRNFSRLETLYDKWISNDCFLGLSIDAVLKQSNLLLAEIEAKMAKDDEEAWEMFRVLMQALQPLLGLIAQLSKDIGTLCRDSSVAMQEAC